MSVSTGASLRIGVVTLTVRDLDRVSRFYQDVIGLHLLDGDSTTARLGVDGTVLLVLRHDAHGRARLSTEAGLFHTAFLLPGRADLGRWARHAAERHVAIRGMADHLVSEAIYLDDPEGNGIEIYADRAASLWHWSDGLVEMSNDRLDVAGLIACAGSEPWNGVPSGTSVGHVHLQVGAIAPAEAFYGGVLGFALTCRYTGASFYGSGGYHHHLATNVWNSRGAAVRTGPVTGLAEVELIGAGPSTLPAIAARASKAGLALEQHDSKLALVDPWGTRIALRAED